MQSLQDSKKAVSVSSTAAPRSIYLITQAHDGLAATSLYCITQKKDGDMTVISVRLRSADDRWQYLDEGYSFTGENKALTTNQINSTIGSRGIDIDKRVKDKFSEAIHLPAIFWGPLSPDYGFIVTKDKQSITVKLNSVDASEILGGNPVEYYTGGQTHTGNKIIKVLNTINPNEVPAEWVSDDGIPWDMAVKTVLKKEQELQKIHLERPDGELLLKTMKEHEEMWKDLGVENTFHRFIKEENQSVAYKAYKEKGYEADDEKELKRHMVVQRPSWTYDGRVIVPNPEPKKPVAEAENEYNKPNFD